MFGQGRRGRLGIAGVSDIACRPPTIDEAVDWLTKMQHMPEYCRSCLTFWKSTMGIAAAKQVFERAPESVRKWINERAMKLAQYKYPMWSAGAGSAGGGCTKEHEHARYDRA